MMTITVDWPVWGETVYIKRHWRRMTQRQIADLVGVSSSHIGDIERGTAKPSYVTVMSICAILDIADPDALTVEAGEL